MQYSFKSCKNQVAMPLNSYATREPLRSQITYELTVVDCFGILLLRLSHLALQWNIFLLILTNEIFKVWNSLPERIKTKFNHNTTAYQLLGIFYVFFLSISFINQHFNQIRILLKRKNFNGITQTSLISWKIALKIACNFQHSHVLTTYIKWKLEVVICLKW